MTQNTGPVLRAEVLRVASELTADQPNPFAVLLNANLLVSWLEQAADEDDLAARLAAMRIQFANLLCSPEPPGDDTMPAFLAASRAFLGYLTAAEVAA